MNAIQSAAGMDHITLLWPNPYLSFKVAGIRTSLPPAQVKVSDGEDTINNHNKIQDKLIPETDDFEKENIKVTSPEPLYRPTRSVRKRKRFPLKTSLHMIERLEICLKMPWVHTGDVGQQCPDMTSPFGPATAAPPCCAQHARETREAIGGA